jgi:two-component system chemotaxis response regulator CheY
MSHTVLVTDDSKIIREMMKDLAAELGWQVVGEAANGEEAINQYTKLRPDVVTLDIIMPGSDGLHALKGIKQINAKAKVLIVSAIDQPEVLREAARLGAADFVVKPFEHERVKRALSLLAQ